ncbi:MAG TPA: phosphatidylinositol mannoside acyltransferase [Acidimicrobiia bacterium]|nr:phosphatidylinositol mannoside acyltransferase [Acidimicrobiia bacterium]
MKRALGYYAYRILSGLFGLLPEPVMRRLGHGAGWLASFIARDRFRMAMRHQARVLGPGGDPRRSARQVFRHYGRYWAETFWMRPRRRDSVLARTSIAGIEHLHGAVASGRGVVLALPHVGNWEMAGLRAAEEDARVLAVAEALGNERIVEWFTEMRRMMQIDVVIARKGARVTRDLMRRLEDGGVIALLCDRDIKGTGVAVEFFGEITTLPAGPVALADRTGAVVLPVGTFFADGAGHAFEVRPPLEIPALDDQAARIEAGVTLLARVVEDIIRTAPAQWHLIVPNWPSDRS